MLGAELALSVVAPAQHATAMTERAAVHAACADLDHVREIGIGLVALILHDARARAVGRMADAELALRIAAPTLHEEAGVYRARVSDQHASLIGAACADVQRVRQFGDDDWSRARARAAVTELTCSVVSPACHRAAGTQRAGVPGARVDFDGVVEALDRDCVRASLRASGR